MAGTLSRTQGEKYREIPSLALSAPGSFQMVKAQQDRDEKISDLVKMMADTYSFVSSVEKYKNGSPLQAVVEQILKQTVECGIFIQEYARHGFGSK